MHTGEAHTHAEETEDIVRVFAEMSSQNQDLLQKERDELEEFEMAYLNSPPRNRLNVTNRKTQTL